MAHAGALQFARGDEAHDGGAADEEELSDFDGAEAVAVEADDEADGVGGIEIGAEFGGDEFAGPEAYFAESGRSGRRVRSGSGEIGRAHV